MERSPTSREALSTDLSFTLKGLQDASKCPVDADPEFLLATADLLTAEAIHHCHLWFQCVAEFARLCYSNGRARIALDAVATAASAASLTGNAKQRRLMLTIFGVLQIDAGNFPASLEALSEALEICEELRDSSATASVLINTSTALINSDMATLAGPACEAALAQARAIESASLRRYLEAAALNNFAYAALHTGRYSDGLLRGRDALSLIELADPSDHMAIELKANCLRNFGNLLLRVGDFEEAKQCVETAVLLVELGVLGTRASSSIENLRGLYDVYTGRYSEGVSRLLATSEAVRTFHKDVEAILLRSLIEAYEISRDGEALVECKQRLARLVQHAGRETLVFHHNRHVGQFLKQYSREDSEFQTSPTQPVSRSVSRRRSGHLQVLEDLCFAGELQDDPGGEHPFRVGRLAQLLSAETGQDGSFCAEINSAARLHDIGKTGTPSDILRAAGPLDCASIEIMRQHSSSGAELLAALGFSNCSMAVLIARHHHERWDGSGYPDRLNGNQIPLPARITAICETFDAMTHDRAYRPKIPTLRALQLIQNHAGGHFDPSLVPAFVRLVDRLMREHKDLDRFLAHGARDASPFLRAKHHLSSQIARWSPPS
jgi:putative two-component system response regulator